VRVVRAWSACKLDFGLGHLALAHRESQRETARCIVDAWPH